MPVACGQEKQAVVLAHEQNLAGCLGVRSCLSLSELDYAESAGPERREPESHFTPQQCPEGKDCALQDPGSERAPVRRSTWIPCLIRDLLSGLRSAAGSQRNLCSPGFVNSIWQLAERTKQACGLRRAESRGLCRAVSGL
ncbi:hypothetical protein AAFF_G00201830 [Aldrovandia affinis]|uniref:Uncharacterized protein n=1 Tax=Aldrovandia affinis TaxID=143900 RepID=A0AAD7WUY8_9TELE|nr:hypothetical protein AAFF_G00201830 [Aldrovandia affinis]